MLSMEEMEKYDEHILMQFINSWTNRKVNINLMSFEIMEELVSRFKKLSLEGKNWRKSAKVSKEAL